MEQQRVRIRDIAEELGLLSAFVFRWPIPRVYFLLSLEECVRFALSLRTFRRKKWMRLLEAPAA